MPRANVAQAAALASRADAAQGGPNVAAGVERFVAAESAAGSKLSDAASAAAEACSIGQGASPSADQVTRASAAARRAAELAAQAKTTLPLPLDFLAVKLLGQAPADEYASLLASAASDLAAIDAHVGVMEGRAAQYDRDVAKAVSVRDDARQRAMRLTVFDELKAEAAAIAADASSVPVSGAGEARALLSEAREVAARARAAYGRMSPTLVSTNVVDNLVAFEHTFEALRQKADAVASRAADCADKLAVAAAAAPASSTCKTDVDCPIGSVCSRQGICVKEQPKDGTAESPSGVAVATGPGATREPVECQVHTDCADDYACVNNKCVKSPSPAEVVAGTNRDTGRGIGTSGNVGGVVTGTTPGLTQRAATVPTLCRAPCVTAWRQRESARAIQGEAGAGPNRLSAGFHL